MYENVFLKLVSYCSPDPKTNSETMNTIFSRFFGQIIKNFRSFFLFIWVFFVKIIIFIGEDSKFVFSKLVVGSGNKNIVYDFFSKPTYH